MRYCILFLSFVLSLKGFSENLLQKNIKLEKSNLQNSVNSQKKVNQLDDERQKLLREYRLTLKKIDNTHIYNEQLREFLVEQKNEMSSLQKQIEQVKDTGKDIIPLILRMFSALEQFIALDIPFLLEERKERISKLREAIKRADVSTSEKYRRLLSAYQIENEYGRTLSAYKGLQVIKGKEVTVDFLRVGRVALIYQTLDRKHTGFWNLKTKQWAPLKRSYKKSVTKAIAVARKQRAPDLLKLPLFTPMEPAQ